MIEGGKSTMRILYFSIFASMFFCIGANSGQAEKPLKFQDRMDELEIHASEIGERFEVFCVRQLAADETEIGGDEILEEKIGRVAMAKMGAQKRIDAAERSTQSDNSYVHYHYLFSNGSWRWGMGSKDLVNLRDTPKDKPLRPKFPDFNPIWISLMTELHYRNAIPVQDFWNKARVISEGESEDGNYWGVVVGADGMCGARVTFAKDPQWAPRQFIFYNHPESKVDINKVTEKEVLSWKVMARTETEWIELKKDKWVPKRVLSWFESPRVKYESEMKFGGWKLGKDVSNDLFSESKFTSDEIAQSIDFNSWEEKYFSQEKKK
jgi:hypothetical protein